MNTNKRRRLLSACVRHVMNVLGKSRRGGVAVSVATGWLCLGRVPECLETMGTHAREGAEDGFGANVIASIEVRNVLFWLGNWFCFCRGSVLMSWGWGKEKWRRFVLLRLGLVRTFYLFASVSDSTIKILLLSGRSLRVSFCSNCSVLFPQLRSEWERARREANC